MFSFYGQKHFKKVNRYGSMPNHTPSVHKTESVGLFGHEMTDALLMEPHEETLLSYSRGIVCLLKKSTVMILFVTKLQTTI